VAGVDKAFLLQGTYYGEANDYPGGIADHPERLGGAAFLDPWAAGARRLFDEAVCHPVSRP